MGKHAKVKVKYGISFKPIKDPKGRGITCPDWFIERQILTHYEQCQAIRTARLLPWCEHFCRLVDIIFGDPKGIWPFEWNPNAMRILKNFRKHHILAIAGHASCVPYETKILDPVTNTEREIGWLCENQIAPMVMTMNGPAQAEVPFLKGEADIYEVETENGKKIRCTAKHRFLTPSGWKRLEEMQVGDPILTYDSTRVAQESLIKNVTLSGKEKFYDITVPGPAHYFAEGFINHNSGKTHAMALIAVMMFWLDPKNTKVLVTSITASAAAGRVWGHVKNCWTHMEGFFGAANMPGKLIDSKNKIRYENNGHKDETRGIELVVGEKSQAKQSASKVQGIKAPKLILMGDEFAELEHSLVRTALTNLKRNDEFWLLGAFNPTDMFGPDGIISRPKDGWHSITEETDEWETYLEEYGYKGYCIRFDGEKSPNILAGHNKYKGLLKVDDLKEAQSQGVRTAAYYQMIRGYWSPVGMLDAIYAAADIVKWRADAKVTTWIEPPTMIAGLDPAFTHGGDRAALVIAKVGIAMSDSGVRQKVFEVVKVYSLDEDVTNTSISKTEWVVKLTKEKLIEHKVDIKNLAIDATGGGDPFSALIARDIGIGFLNVKFSGKASDKPVSRNDPRKGFERFRNMVSELWYVGRELIRSGQIKGLTGDIMSEMVVRTYKESNGLVCVEPKDDMKARIKKSPDFADACFLALFLARVRHGLSSNEMAAPRPAARSSSYGGLFPPIDLNRRQPQQVMPRYIDIGGGWMSGIT